MQRVVIKDRTLQKLYQDFLKMLFNEYENEWKSQNQQDDADTIRLNDKRNEEMQKKRDLILKLKKKDIESLAYQPNPFLTDYELPNVSWYYYSLVELRLT